LCWCAGADRGERDDRVGQNARGAARGNAGFTSGGCTKGDDVTAVAAAREDGRAARRRCTLGGRDGGEETQRADTANVLLIERAQLVDLISEIPEELTEDSVAELARTGAFAKCNGLGEDKVVASCGFDLLVTRPVFIGSAAAFLFDAGCVLSRLKAARAGCVGRVGARGGDAFRCEFAEGGVGVCVADAGAELSAPFAEVLMARGFIKGRTGHVAFF